MWCITRVTRVAVVPLHFFTSHLGVKFILSKTYIKVDCAPLNLLFHKKILLASKEKYDMLVFFFRFLYQDVWSNIAGDWSREGNMG